MTTSPGTARELYEERGYVLLPEPIVEAPFLRRALERIPALIRGEHDTGVNPWRRYNVGDLHKMQKIDQVHLCDKAFHVLATHPRIGEEVARVTGAEMVQIWATQLFLKPPGGGALGVIGWHTDRDNWAFWEGEVLTVWLALEDFGEDSGPVLYVEGSHAWPDADKQGDAYEQDLAALEERMKEQGSGREWRKVPVLVQAGGAGIHSADIIHGSRANRSSVARVGLGINVRTNRARPKRGVEDYGYTSYLDHPFISPVIYRRGGASLQSPATSGGAAKETSAAADRAAKARGNEAASPKPASQAAASAFVPPRSVAREGAFLMPHLRKGMRVLDVGCGAGSITTGLAHFVAPGALTAVDNDPEQLELARAAVQRMGLGNAEVVEADAHRLPFEDGMFDAVFCHAVFAELADPESAMRELYRVCKAGGLIGVREQLGLFDRLGTVTVHGSQAPFSELMREVARAGVGAPDVGVRLKGLLIAAGFDRVSTRAPTEIYSEPAELVVLAAIVQSALRGNLGERAISAGVSSRAEMQDVMARSHDWPSDPGALCVVSWIEHVAHKPASG